MEALGSNCGYSLKGGVEFCEDGIIIFAVAV